MPGLCDVNVLLALSTDRHGPRLWTDAYLAAYARAGGLTVVTFDRGFRQFPDLSCELLAPGGPAT